MALLHLHSDDLRVGILAQGGALVDVRTPHQDRNLVLGFADPADHQRIEVYAGVIIGPVANRITAGRIEIGGHVHQMPLNENKRTALHSGPEGLHARTWQVTAHRQDHLTLETRLPDGACGLPGNRQFKALYTLSGTTLTLVLEARSDKPTAINMAAHPYWNLDGGADISGHRLQVLADRLLPTDAENLPIGHTAPTTGHRFDFSQPRPVPLDPGLDFNFCLSDHMRADPVPAAVLTGGDGTRLEIATTAPGLQVYGGAHLAPRRGLLGGGGDLLPFGGIALEPQGWPDAPKNPGFPQILLHPGHIYRQISAYAIFTP